MDISDTIALSAPPAESVHTHNLRNLLHAEGVEATIHAGHRLSRGGQHPILEALAGCSNHVDLLQRFSRVEPLLHQGNRTEFELIDNGIKVTHLPTNNSTIDPAESLFVCGAQVGMLERIGYSEVTASFFSGTPIWPWTQPASAVIRHLQPQMRCIQWMLTWELAPNHQDHCAADTASNLVRQLVSSNPSRPWTVSAVAKELGVSARTLQRRLSEANTCFAALVIEVRLDEAEALLTRTILPVGTIAQLSGFYDHAHLTKCMKSVRGRTPTAIRRAPEEILLVRRALSR